MVKLTWVEELEHWLPELTPGRIRVVGGRNDIDSWKTTKRPAKTTSNTNNTPLGNNPISPGTHPESGGDDDEEKIAFVIVTYGLFTQSAPAATALLNAKFQCDSSLLLSLSHTHIHTSTSI